MLIFVPNKFEFDSVDDYLLIKFPSVITPDKFALAWKIKVDGFCWIDTAWQTNKQVKQINQTRREGMKEARMIRVSPLVMPSVRFVLKSWQFVIGPLTHSK